ncbi:tyrosine-type recombinase/integrase [Rhodobacter ferrooxidans]|uniref:Integrase family protein n=1 Tax=Rhodobacter ferrooxidans TaxID=371731 RepID=C8S4W2_9RHOB|nr:tyrosine-type recombinase/integrase [Rhodobacter sp. SW2]EEW24021.1 integrase family protein [Rhodobacter sp. SW2]
MSKISLPRHVHHVISGGRDYFYYQEGRGTPHQGERIRLPDKPQTPEFWNAVRQAQGTFGPTPTDTVGALIDAYEGAWPTLQRKLSKGTQEQYRRNLKPSRKAWGDLPARDLRPKHVDALIRKIGAERPGAANNVLDALKALCRWANGPVDLLAHDPTKGVHRFEKGAGHEPWTEAQLAFAEQTFTGPLRRYYFLSRYTGQRISDVVRLNPGDVDDGGFSLRQKKTGVKPWCPIFAELETEMATWERRLGPYLLQEIGKSAGKPFSTNQMWKAFDAERAKHPILAGAVPHGLRANAVIRLRVGGYSALQISDMVGMSVEMVEHYCRHSDRKASGQAVLREIRERETKQPVKPWKSGKQE